MLVALNHLLIYISLSLLTLKKSFVRWVFYILQLIYFKQSIECFRRQWLESSRMYDYSSFPSGNSG